MAEQIVLRLDDMAHGGAAVGRHEGKAVFVPYGIAGESVRVEVVQDKRHYVHARLIEILDASPERVEPPCPYFAQCGGCHWQHIAYTAQLQHKESIVRSQLQRIAGLSAPNVLPMLGMEEPWHYRNHMQFAAGTQGQLGLTAAGSNRIVPIERCLLMHPLLEEIFDAIDIHIPDLRRVSLRAGLRTGEQMILFEMAEDLAPDLEVNLPVSCVLLRADGSSEALIGQPYFHEVVAGMTWRVSASSFFQVNTVQAERLVTLASSYLDPTSGSTVIDGYCGVGTLSLGFARRVKKLVGIDVSDSAIADARANAAGIASALFICGRLQDSIPTTWTEPPLVVIDPPRTGLDKADLMALTGLAPWRIVYVSCDPATLARDVRRLADTRYFLRQVQPIDMFPQTCHIESVTLLERQ